MKRIISLLLCATVIVGSALTMTSCSGAGSDIMTLNVGGYPDTIDPALNSAVDGGTYIAHTFSGLIGYELDSKGNPVLVPQCAVELPEGVLLEDGRTSYTFKLRDNLKWSDGTPLTAHDFVYAWNRAADPMTAASYEYMFNVIDGYEDLQSMYDENGKLLVSEKKTLNVTASDDGKELRVVLSVDVPYFYELCAFPAYMPVKREIVEEYGEEWATSSETYIGNGAYKITEFTLTQMVMEKNEFFYNADAVKTEKIIFAFNANDASLLINYKNGSYHFIDSVSNDEIDRLKQEYKGEYAVKGQLGTGYISFNVNDTALKDFSEDEKVKIRKALGLLIDRNYVVEEIGKAGQIPAAGFVATGLTEPDGTEYVSRNGLNRDGNGYFSIKEEDYTNNCKEALRLFEEVAASSGKISVVDGKVKNFPALTYITNESSLHEAVAAYLQQVWGNYGITVKVEVQEWATFLNTRKSGNYSVARNGWLGDYNDPISFLDMWISASGNNDSQLGKGSHASYAAFSYNGKDKLTWANSYDKVISDVKKENDSEKRFELMHEAEDILMSTGAICPIYYDADIYICSKRINGFFSTPLGFKYFMYATLE